MGEVRLGRPKKPLVLSAHEQEQLRGIAQSRALPNGIVRRARMVLLSAVLPNPQELAEWVTGDPKAVASSVGHAAVGERGGGALEYKR